MTTPKLKGLSTLNCRQGAALLQPAELNDKLRTLPGWDHADQRLEKTFRFEREFKFDDYYRTMAFVNAVAYIAHRQDHHPDLSVHYNRVVVSYSTHDAGGVTLNDCICAAKVESLNEG